MTATARLLSIATATPPYVIRQGTAAAVAHQAFAPRFPEFDQLRPVFDNAGISTRYGVRPIDWYLEPRGWPERTQVYLEGGAALFVEAARQAIERAGLKPRDIDAIVTVSSTGIATPSLEARVMGAMGFRPNVARAPIFGLGCAGGVSGLSIAARLARGQPGSNVLLVALEICTLSFRLDKLTKANVVATALFGDGAAACVLRADASSGLAEIEGAGEYTWPDTLSIMGWDVDPQGFGVIFDRDIPPFAEQHIAPALEAILGGAGLGLEDVDRFVFHPGGMKVLHALEQALWLGQGALDHERDVLSDYGNMSGPTALFVLKRVLDKGLPDRIALAAMGPGLHGELRRPEARRMTGFLLLALVSLERLGELLWARANTRRLIAQGGYEIGASHYPAIVALHSVWLAGLWLLARDRPVEPLWIAVFVGFLLMRAWVLATLGRRWTTRVIVVPGETLVRKGPYRLIAHPNYVVVAGEIAALPLCFGLWRYALVFTLLNAAILFVRIRAEDEALSVVAGEARQSTP